VTTFEDAECKICGEGIVKLNGVWQHDNMNGDHKAQPKPGTVVKTTGNW
jgi:hypothetical protein